MAIATTPLHYVPLVVGTWAVATLGMSRIGYLGMELFLGLINGIAINTGDKLGHKKSRSRRIWPHWGWRGVRLTLARVTLAAWATADWSFRRN